MHRNICIFGTSLGCARRKNIEESLIKTMTNLLFFFNKVVAGGGFPFKAEKIWGEGGEIPFKAEKIFFFYWTSLILKKLY